LIQDYEAPVSRRYDLDEEIMTVYDLLDAADMCATGDARVTDGSLFARSCEGGDWRRLGATDGD
jgi:hypothetical protein